MICCHLPVNIPWTGCRWWQSVSSLDSRFLPGSNIDFVWNTSEKYNNLPIRSDHQKKKILPYRSHWKQQRRWRSICSENKQGSSLRQNRENKSSFTILIERSFWWECFCTIRVVGCGQQHQQGGEGHRQVPEMQIPLLILLRILNIQHTGPKSVHPVLNVGKVSISV